MVSNASELFPLPLGPVMTLSFPSGRSRSIPFEVVLPRPANLHHLFQWLLRRQRRKLWFVGPSSARAIDTRQLYLALDQKGRDVRPHFSSPPLHSDPPQALPRDRPLPSSILPLDGSSSPASLSSSPSVSSVSLGDQVPLGNAPPLRSSTSPVYLPATRHPHPASRNPQSGCVFCRHKNVPPLIPLALSTSATSSIQLESRLSFAFPPPMNR